MFKPTDRQTELFGVSSHLADSARERLEKTWAEPFRRKVMPILLDAEQDFADLYPSETGRGCWSIARKLGLCILQELQDLTDEQTVDALSFDARFQHALMLAPDQAYLSRISLWDFRCRLIEADPEMKRLGELMQRIAKEAIDELDLDISVQRCDSTHITSNIETKSRADLFRKTLRHFDGWLNKEWPDERKKLSDELIEWLDAEPEHWFGRLSKEEYKARLEKLARWLLEIIETFEEHEDISTHERFGLIVQLFDEHCIVKSSSKGDDSGGQNGSGGSDSSSRSSSVSKAGEPQTADADKSTASANSSQAKLRHRPRGGSRSLQSPYDPDAGYTAHKGTGYSQHIVETCGNEDKPEIIVHQEVHPAEVDCGRMSPILNKLRRADLKPDKMLADAGYGTGAEVLKARVKGTELLAPIPRGNQAKDKFGRERFDIDEKTGKVNRCPAGKKPCRHGMRRSQSRRKGQSLHAYFYPSHCESCPLFEQCPTSPPDSGRGAYQLELRPAQLARDRRLAEQDTDEFWEEYGLRSGVEATASELKRAHGVGELRVRRLPKVRMKAALKTCACNIKRWLRAAPESMRHLLAALFCLLSLPSGDLGRPSRRISMATA